MNKMYDEVLEFICLHYKLGNRTDDPYWIDARTQMKVPDRLRPLKKPLWFQCWKSAKVDLAQILKAMPDHKTLLRDIRGELKQPVFGMAGAMQPTVPMPGAMPPAPVIENMPNFTEIESGAKDLQLF